MTENESSLQPGSREPKVGPGRKSRTPVVALATVAVLIIGLIAYRAIQNDQVATNDSEQLSAPGESTVATLVESEDWILETTRRLPDLANGVLNMQLPDVQAADLFAEEIKVLELEADGPHHNKFSIPRLSVDSKSWALQDAPRSSTPKQTTLWNPLFSELSYFERAKFYFVKAEFDEDDHNSITAHVNFDGVARTPKDELVHVKAKQLVGWKKPEGADSDAWKITSWKQKSMTTTHRQQHLFQDVVHTVIPKELRQQVQESAHEKMLLELGTSSDAVPPHPHFSPHASDRHPAVSVVDIDRDGFDDVYVMARWGRNLMFRNRGDGTFEEIAAEIGLDVEDHCSSAIFADFDNDGDSDLFLGRTLQRSMYFTNEDGRFVDRTASNISTDLPYLVFSMSSADYNNDGLMDILLCTYAQETQNISKPDPKTQSWLSEFLAPKQAQKLFQLRMNHHLLNRSGPPNMLLVNRGGGKFDLAKENSQVEAWRQTTQGTWSDVDEDGDLDLYLSNDFSVNTMFRNDGADGFTDVTEETATADIGFGMGVSWGDYDLDGRQDLYVSNMFSKAGQRITSQLASGDPRYANMARGNSLFRNMNGNFEKVSGLDASDLQVEMAGWSWGSQFIDIDNDGYLDIHALSGFYTAPKQIALAADY